MLKIKLKSLAAEAKIIRKEERKGGYYREELYRHRIDVVRYEARHTHIAYGLIRGRTLDQIERADSRPFDHKRVEAMCLKYGPVAQPG